MSISAPPSAFGGAPLFLRRLFGCSSSNRLAFPLCAPCPPTAHRPTASEGVVVEVQQCRLTALVRPAVAHLGATWYDARAKSETRSYGARIANTMRPTCTIQPFECVHVPYERVPHKRPSSSAFDGGCASYSTEQRVRRSNIPLIASHLHLESFGDARAAPTGLRGCGQGSSVRPAPMRRSAVVRARMDSHAHQCLPTPKRPRVQPPATR